MVWGMSLPSGFGDYWPDGRFESDPQQPLQDGWGGRLKQYYFAQTPEDQKVLYDHRGDVSLATHSYPYFVSLKFSREKGSSVDAETPPISAIKPHEPPQYFHTLKNYKNLASLIHTESRIVAVDEALKSIIERLEPETHQFFPIEIRMRREKVYPIQYYILVVRQHFDSFSPGESRDDSYRKDGVDFYFHEETKKAMSGLAFNRTIFDGAHLWRERRLSREWLTCFSDELIAEIDRADLRLPRHYKMKEV